MKKICLTILLFIAFNGSTQMGVITISSDEFAPYNQWYSICEVGYENEIFYYNKNHLADAVLTNLLRRWGLNIMDGVVDEDGDLTWQLDYHNGYSATVFMIRIEDKDDESLVIVITSKNN
jgi:hypothetical protein